MFDRLPGFEDFIDESKDNIFDEGNLTQQQRQIFREFNTINALRDALGISLKGSKNATYKDIINFGASIIPEILGDQRILFNDKKLNPLYEEYRERADALSKQENKEVSVLEAVERGIDEYNSLINASKNDNVYFLKKKLEQLITLQKTLHASSHSETNLIIRDVYKVRRGLPFEDGKDYRDFKVADDRAIRIRVLHPDYLEYITGADLIYECYSEVYKKVRIAAIQYKIRRSKSVYVDERIERQLERLENAFCAKGMCLINQDKNPYRLPYCTAFLRPTDEIQSDNPNIMSKGYYVPICVLKSVREKGELDNPNIIPSKRLRDHAVTHKVFEELFNADMLGSKWITYDELKLVYTSSKILTPHQSITIHVQEFTEKKAKVPRRKAARQ